MRVRMYIIHVLLYIYSNVKLVLKAYSSNKMIIEKKGIVSPAMSGSQTPNDPAYAKIY